MTRRSGVTPNRHTCHWFRDGQALTDADPSLGVYLAQQTDATIYIFDRYGKLIKQIAANGEGWDGTFNGNPVPSTDYWFTVTYKEYIGDKEITKEFKAHFSLKR